MSGVRREEILDEYRKHARCQLEAEIPEADSYHVLVMK